MERGRKRKTKRWRVKESDRVRGAWVEGGGWGGEVEREKTFTKLLIYCIKHVDM